MQSYFPVSHAMKRGVAPSRSAASVAAPLESKCTAESMCPSWHAMKSGVAPSDLARSTGADAASSSETQSA